MNTPSIDIMYFEPGKPGVSKTIEHTLEAMQAEVGGWIEQVSIRSIGPLSRSPLVVVCNEEGRLHGMPPNRWGFVGPFFVTRTKGDSYTSLTEADKALIAKIPDDARFPKSRSRTKR